MSRDYYLKLAHIYEQMQLTNSKAKKVKTVKHSLLKEFTTSPGYDSMPSPDDRKKFSGSNWRALQIAGKMAKLENEIVRLKELGAPYKDEDNEWKELARRLIDSAGEKAHEVLQGERERFSKYDEPFNMDDIKEYRANPTGDDIPEGPL